MTIYAILLGKAAEAFGKQLALDVGTGLVETIFNQKRIANELENIRLQLLAISAALAQLPGVFYEVATQVQAETAQRRLVEAVNTVVGSLITLGEKRAGDPNKEGYKESVRRAADTLHEDAKRLFEDAGVLISYGQVYYATVSTAFLAGIKAYAALVEIDPDLFKEFANRLATWRAPLRSWVDASVPSSLAGVDRGLDTTYSIARHALDGMDTRTKHIETRYVLGWRRFDTPADPVSGTPASARVEVYVAWFSFNGVGIGGDEPFGFSFEASPDAPTTRQEVLARAASQPRPAVSPEWFWDVVDNGFSGRPAYDACVGRLWQLISAMQAYPKLSPPIKGAVGTVNAMLAEIDAILAQPIAAAAIATAQAKVEFMRAA